ncbi:hypothetical protein N510_000302 [Firmicutes bacterium ASF500]|nr:hypothetical protein N510_000302 [Firmicutes bacterium ASF500]
MKKTLSLALALVMCLALFPVTVSALNDGTFDYTISDDGVAINRLIDMSIEDLVIPDTIAGKPVVSVTGLHGSGCKLRSVVIPSSVKEIGYMCFKNSYRSCEYLTSVTLSEGLEKIGYQAFDGTHITSIVIPESVKTIEYDAFRYCEYLTSVKLPSQLEAIPRQCFANCTSLDDIIIPDKVTSIGRHALTETAITKISVPTGVKKIDDFCVSCKNLSEVELPYGLEEIGGNSFSGCSKLKSVLIPTTVKVVGLHSFNNSGIEEIILPYGVETFYGAGYNCDNLTGIYAPSTVRSLHSIVDNAIVYCMPDSKVEAECKKDGISCLSDISCDTRINVLHNGKRISFGAYGQNPEIVNSRTMVPLRSIFEAMGADIQWDGATQTVTATRGSNKIVMTVGQAGYTVNGAAKTMDTPPMILNDRTMVPVRVVAESFGADVTWHAASGTVLISE